MTARTRLTLLHTLLVLASGALLSLLTYLLTRRSLTERKIVWHLTGPGTTGPPPPADLSSSELAGDVRDEALATLVRQAGIALVVVTLLGAVVGRLVAGRVLLPIRVISATAQRLSAENLSERMPVGRAGDELAALAETVNGMLDRIGLGIAERDRALESQRLFTASAAHELRAPLTTMRTAIDVTLDGEPCRAELRAMALDVRAAVDRHRRTLDGLFALAHSQAGVRECRPVDLAAVAGSVLKATVPGLGATDLAVRWELCPAPMAGDPVLLERMAANLIGNAVRYNHPAGLLTVSTGRTPDGASFLRVVNTGNRVAQEDVEQLLRPFVRGAGSSAVRSDDGGGDGAGAGLGLSIVQAVVLAHRGDITATPHQDGGLNVLVRFRHAQEPPAHSAETGAGRDDPGR
ncbi:HAMP domain-containing histidine kinase [Streptomyces sp. UH6]|nr:HAMP domain-containing histidine kinase [Streptomyces sp. UH6]